MSAPFIMIVFMFLGVGFTYVRHLFSENISFQLIISVLFAVSIPSLLCYLFVKRLYYVATKKLDILLPENSFKFCVFCLGVLLMFLCAFITYGFLSVLLKSFLFSENIPINGIPLGIAIQLFIVGFILTELTRKKC